MNSTLQWAASEIRRSIASNEVHLWAWSFEPLAFDVAAHLELLDHAEQRRAERFHFAADRGRYVMAHANLRRILGGYRNLPPQHLRFHANVFGKPELDHDPSSSLHFSLSHSHRTAILAVTHALPVGVDVEDVRPIEAEVADTHFSSTELNQLRGLQGDAWLAGFYRCWTRKEAILKAEGVGLHRPLDSFDVSLQSTETAELFATREPFRYPWKLHHVSPGPGTVGALATAHDNAHLACFSFRATPG